MARRNAWPVADSGRHWAWKGYIFPIGKISLSQDHPAVPLLTLADAGLAYFDQMREALDPEKTVADSVAGTEKHVISYLSDFLFSPRREVAAAWAAAKPNGR